MRNLRHLSVLKRSAVILGIAATILHVALFSLHVTASARGVLASLAAPGSAELTLAIGNLCGPDRTSGSLASVPEDGSSGGDKPSKGYRCPICLGTVAAACLASPAFVFAAKVEFEPVPLRAGGDVSLVADRLRHAPGTIRGPPAV